MVGEWEKITQIAFEKGGIVMSFDHSCKNTRPASFWNNFEGSLKRTLTPIHEHEFGLGYDIQYKDASGKVQGELHGLKSEEAGYLKNIKGKW